QPAGERRGLAGQHQERRLERVVGVGFVAEPAAADAQHHRPVPADDGRERLLVAVAHEEVEELTVGAVGPRQFGDGDVIQNLNDRVGQRALGVSSALPYQLLPARGPFDTRGCGIDALDATTGTEGKGECVMRPRKVAGTLRVPRLLSGEYRPRHTECACY